MHELGIVIEVVNMVKKIAEDEGIDKVDAIVLQIGELSPVIPRFVEECYPAAVDGSGMEDTKLIIETIPGNAKCSQCETIFNVIQREGYCPKCGSFDKDILSGTEFFLKEIQVTE
jgi:hydrogenase nickel incorporation protein HypA/HybF